jgi:DNA polymerase
MSEPESAAEFVPEHADLAALRTAAAGCRGCELYRDATQTVFGDGAAAARVMLVGEQPGDKEDRAGEPFVGPAGRLLDRALADAGLDRGRCYLTNAVKHFRFTRAPGKPRLHKKPSVGQINACRPWLTAEYAAVRPAVVVALGATAVRAVLGTRYKVTADRGRLLPCPQAGADAQAVISTHPSAILRAPDDARDEALAALVSDLRVVTTAINGSCDG